MKKLKKIFRFLLVIMFIMLSQSPAQAINKTHWIDDGIAASSFSGGTGKLEDPYLISTAEELAYLAVQANAGLLKQNPTEGKHYKLINNIDLSKYLWAPIGSHYNIGNDFMGYFNGDFHTITGMRIVDGFDCSGLFGTARGIKNLSLEGSIDIANMTEQPSTYMGGMLGTGLELFNCHSNVSISISTTSHMPYWLGGLAGGGNISVNCSSSGPIEVNFLEPINANFTIGGLAGAASLVENSFSHTDISIFGKQGANWCNIGGIAGEYWPNFMKPMSNCYNVGNVAVTNVKNASVGAIIGMIGGTLQNGTEIWLAPQNCYWLSTATTFPEDADNDGVGSTGNPDSSGVSNFSGAKTNWTLNNEERTELLTALNSWVNSKSDEWYFSWRSAFSETENGGFPLFDTFSSSPDDNAVVGINNGDSIRQGDVIAFTAIGSGPNKAAVFGNHRWRPYSWNINPSGIWTVPPYSAVIPTEDMSAGEHLLTVTFSEERFNGSTWALTGNTMSQSVAFTITAKVFKITASTGVGGYISPSGVIEADLNSEKVFSIFANKGYAIHRVNVDGVNQGVLSTYTFANIDKDHSIHADFVLDTELPLTGDNNTILISVLLMFLSTASLLFTLRKRKNSR